MPRKKPIKSVELDAQQKEDVRKHATNLRMLRDICDYIEERQGTERTALIELFGERDEPYVDEALRVTISNKSQLVARSRKAKRELSKKKVLELWEKNILKIDPYKMRKRLGEKATPYIQEKIRGQNVYVNVTDPALYETLAYVLVRRGDFRGAYDLVASYASEHPEDPKGALNKAAMETLLGTRMQAQRKKDSRKKY